MEPEFMILNKNSNINLYLGINTESRPVIFIEDINDETVMKKLVDTISLPFKSDFSRQAINYYLISRIQEMYLGNRDEEIVKKYVDLQSIIFAIELNSEKISDFVKRCVEDPYSRCQEDAKFEQKPIERTLFRLEAELLDKAEDLQDYVLKVIRPSGIEGYLQLNAKYESFGVIGLKENEKNFGSSPAFYDLIDIIRVMNKESHTMCKMFVKTQIRHALSNNGFSLADLNDEIVWEIIHEYVEELIKFVTNSM